MSIPYRWLKFGDIELDLNFMDEPILDIFTTKITEISSGYFGRSNYLIGYRDGFGNHLNKFLIDSEAGLKITYFEEDYLVFAGKYDSVVFRIGAFPVKITDWLIDNLHESITRPYDQTYYTLYDVFKVIANCESIYLGTTELHSNVVAITTSYRLTKAKIYLSSYTRKMNYRISKMKSMLSLE